MWNLLPAHHALHVRHALLRASRTKPRSSSSAAVAAAWTAVRHAGGRRGSGGVRSVQRQLQPLLPTRHSRLTGPGWCCRCVCGAAQTAPVPSASGAASSGDTAPPRPVMYVAAAALIDETGHVLLSLRPPTDRNNPLRFEFPGGKVERGEAPQDALCRELHEELGIHVRPEDCQPLVFSSQRHLGRLACLTLLLFAVRNWSGTPRAKEGQPSLVWVSAETLNTESLSMPALDEPLLPAVRAAMRAIGCGACGERVASAAGEACCAPHAH